MRAGDTLTDWRKVDQNSLNTPTSMIAVKAGVRDILRSISCVKGPMVVSRTRMMWWE